MKQDYNGESTAYNKKVHYFIINFKILGTCIVCMRFEFQTWNVHNMSVVFGNTLGLLWREFLKCLACIPIIRNL